MAEAEGLQAVAAGRRAQDAKRRPAMRRAFVVARQRKSDGLSHMEPYMWNRDDADNSRSKVSVHP